MKKHGVTYNLTGKALTGSLRQLFNPFSSKPKSRTLRQIKTLEVTGLIHLHPHQRVKV